jgi:hypothetical protein
MSVDADADADAGSAVLIEREPREAVGKVQRQVVVIQWTL